MAKRNATNPVDPKAHEPKVHEPKILEYAPANEYRPPREGSKAAALIAAMSRNKGATLQDLVAVLAYFNAQGIGKQSAETPDYARSWLPPSYLRTNFGVGITSKVCSVKGSDGKMVKTLRVWVKKPEKVAAPTVRKSRKAAAPKAPKAGSVTATAPKGSGAAPKAPKKGAEQGAGAAA